MGPDEKLNDLRSEMEKGLVVLAAISTDPSHLLAILGEGEDFYHCHRYSRLPNGEWIASRDAYGPVEVVWEWLNGQGMEGMRV